MKAIGLTRGPSHVDVDIAADGPARLLQSLQKRSDAPLPFRIIRGQVHQHADAPHSLVLLRVRRERPGSRSAEKRDKVAAVAHSITSSAMASTPEGIVRPSVLAVLRLITNSNFVGRITGRSPGLSPLRMRPA